MCIRDRTFDDQKREKYVEWFGYSASVSPYILEQFEKWAGYPFRPEYIVDQGLSLIHIFRKNGFVVSRLLRKSMHSEVTQLVG